MSRPNLKNIVISILLIPLRIPLLLCLLITFPLEVLVHWTDEMINMEDTN